MLIEFHTTTAEKHSCIVRLIDYFSAFHHKENHNVNINKAEKIKYSLLTTDGHPAPWIEEKLSNEEKSIIVEILCNLINLNIDHHNYNNRYKCNC